MTIGLHLIDLAAAVESQRRPDHRTPRLPRERPGRLRSTLGGVLVGLGERISGTRAPAVAGHDPGC